MSHPKGKLIAIGGAEHKGTALEVDGFQRNNLNFFELGILRRVVEEAGGINARIEVITTASMIPYEVGENYLNAFGKMGCTNIGLLHIRTRQDAMLQENVERIRHCNAVMFSGGNQLRLSATDGGTEFLSLLKKRYNEEENFLICWSNGHEQYYDIRG
jgi:cyanophycinase